MEITTTQPCCNTCIKLHGEPVKTSAGFGIKNKCYINQSQPTTIIDPSIYICLNYQSKHQ
jgi:hypothetical protein